MTIKSNTCIAVVSDGKYLYFAGDRRMSWGFHIAQVMPNPKVVYRSGILFAGTGICSILELVSRFTDLPPLHGFQDEDPYYYVSQRLVPAVVERLKLAGHLKKDELVLRNKEHDTAVLIGIQNRLFELTIAEEIIEASEVGIPYAHGCGGSVALGALLANSRLKPVDRLTKAIEIAASVSPGCDKNIDIISNNPKFKPVVSKHKSVWS